MIVFDADVLAKEAMARTGLEDFGPDTWQEGLGVYCDSIRSEAQLNDLGTVAVSENIIGSLSARLRIIHWLSRHPGVRHHEVEAPVIVIGLFRAGTTMLSQLLDIDPHARSLLGWEATDPVPPPDPRAHKHGARVDAARTRAQLLDQLNPGMKAIHHEEPDGPTECLTLLAQDFRSLMWESITNVGAYGDWLLAADPLPAYQHHRRALQVLQSGGVAGRWTLKSPHHALCLDALTNVYADARLVYLHRDPAVVVASACSLMSTLTATFSDADHRDYIADRWTTVLEACVQRVEEFRMRVPDHPILDLHYRDLVADPIAAVEQLYAFTGRSLDPAVEHRMRDHLERNPKGRFGTHRYRLEDHGLDPADVRARFGRYTTRYEVAAEA